MLALFCIVHTNTYKTYGPKTIVKRFVFKHKRR